MVQKRVAEPSRCLHGPCTHIEFQGISKQFPRIGHVIVDLNFQTPLLQVQPDARFESPSLCRALFEIYLGEKPIIPDTIGRWAEGTKKLLDSENERRSSRKGGSG